MSNENEPWCDIGAGLLTDGLDDLARDVGTAGFAAIWRGIAQQPSDLVNADA